MKELGKSIYKPELSNRGDYQGLTRNLHERFGLKLSWSVYSRLRTPLSGATLGLTIGFIDAAH